MKKYRIVFIFFYTFFSLLDNWRLLKLMNSIVSKKKIGHYCFGLNCFECCLQHYIVILYYYLLIKYYLCIYSLYS